ncbi:MULTISPECIES: cation diffusion facilitator family transporter [Marinobacter]|jgi:cation diffusion facilitator family transporter|uniref:cation diffusion facilitator family transporter n=1 Tax=Marinobacter TaxID=2742 RepID=UPI000C3D4B8F|nr:MULTISPECIES: cation diffusion facilitator family transporter [Marinobacter]MBL83296.1 cation-efflux pump [Marinobacter sp.]MCZ4285620.1 cation diffusion facilitator family transporter [Marinobacter salarius]MDM8179247.1 cation diffusion facilitator family transporter [Marinobacter salarius]RUT74456.1 cation transporter [Marinobacter sp. NP-6]VVS96820.1 Cation-efflux pump [Marinobacter salarius]|tara:strand:- start:1495 stop:2661 length:1167 start_codon:yes stop_codon:yes gene_type:complete
MTDQQTFSSQEHKGLPQERRAASRVTVIGMLLDGVLGILKVIAGTLFHSQALLVDGIHSFTDVASDLVVLGVMRVSRQAPDQDHPYGHQRIETMGTMVLGSILIAVGAALAWDNTLRLLDGGAVNIPEWPVLVAAVISIASKEWIYRYTRRVGIAIRSDLIIANAWHSRTDALSSVVVLFSTIGAMLGYLWLDILAAVIISGIIIHIGWRFTRDSVKELVDTGLSPEDTEALKHIASKTDGVRNVHELRSRRMGHDILLDVHLVVSPEISVSEGHQIGMQVVKAMRNALDNILDINFHIDAENDEIHPQTSEQLPARAEIREVLHQHIENLPSNNRLRLHYLRNRVHMELFMEIPESEALPDARQISEDLGRYAWFGSLRIWHAHTEN